MCLVCRHRNCKNRKGYASASTAAGAHANDMYYVGNFVHPTAASLPPLHDRPAGCSKCHPHPSPGRKEAEQQPCRSYPTGNVVPPLWGPVHPNRRPSDFRIPQGHSTVCTLQPQIDPRVSGKDAGWWHAVRCAETSAITLTGCCSFEHKLGSLHPYDLDKLPEAQIRPKLSKGVPASTLPHLVIPPAPGHRF